MIRRGRLPDVEIPPGTKVIADLHLDLGASAGGEPFLEWLESEKEHFHARVREEFLSLAAAEPERFLVLDASLPPDELAAAVRARVEPLLA